MSQLLDILSDALSAIGQLGTGQSLNPEQGEQGRRIANRMVGKWSLQRYMLFTIAQRALTLSAGIRDYTLGPTGTLGVNPQTRPVFVESARVSGVGSQQESAISIVDPVEWGAIRDKGATNSILGLPQLIWPEYTMPNIGLHLWPIPSAAITLTLGTWEQLQQFVSIFDVLNFPPGYEEPLMWNIAMEWAPFFDMPVTPSIQQLAADGLLKIQGINAQGLGGALGEAQRLDPPNLAKPIPTGGQ